MINKLVWAIYLVVPCSQPDTKSWNTLQPQRSNSSDTPSTLFHNSAKMEDTCR